MATNMYIVPCSTEWGLSSVCSFKYQLPSIRAGSLANKWLFFTSQGNLTGLSRGKMTKCGWDLHKPKQRD